jgi:hypothetical protein
MPKKEKPLPKPPGAGGKARRYAGEGEAAPLTADRIAQAISEGRLEEFMKTEIPDNKYAGKLVSMMMGMTGMVPPEIPQSGAPREEKQDVAPPPGDLREAVDAGDVKGVFEILRREHEKRSSSPGHTPEPADEEAKTGPSSLEKQLLDDLMKIAADNSVTLDWLISRALALYVRDYTATGRL